MNKYTNYYYHCGTEWEDDDCDSMHNDHCPVCDAEITPYKSKENKKGGEEIDHGDLDNLKFVETLKREDFTFESDAYGYMLKYKGKKIGGAGTLTRKPKHWQHAKKDRKDHKESAERDIDAILNGNGQERYLKVVKKIEAEGGLTAEQKKVKEYFARANARMLKKLDIKLTPEDEDQGIDGCATCRKRATFAAPSIKVYLEKGGIEDFQTLFSDFLSDLNHLADYLKIDFDEAIEKGERAYVQEVEGEKEWRESLKAKNKSRRYLPCRNRAA